MFTTDFCFMRQQVSCRVCLLYDFITVVSFTVVAYVFTLVLRTIGLEQTSRGIVCTHAACFYFHHLNLLNFQKMIQWIFN